MRFLRCGAARAVRIVSQSHRWLPFLISVVIIAADRWTKILIKHTLTAFDSIPVIPGWLRIIHTENPGAAFGILAEGNHWLRSGILIGVSSLVLIFVISALWSGRSGLRSPLARIALGLVLGGAAGNLYDRVVHSTVTDFIEVYHRGWAFPAFNVADSAITIGAMLLIVELIQPRRA